MADASIALVSTAVGDDLVDRHRARRLERVVALEPGQLDDLLHEPGEPVALGDHPLGEPLHGLRVVGGVARRPRTAAGWRRPGSSARG